MRWRLTRPAGRAGLAGLLFLAASAVGGRSASAQQVTRSGWFEVIWGEAPTQFAAASEPRFVLIDDEGRWTELTLDASLAQPFGGALSLNRKRVRIVGREAVPEPGAGGIDEKPLIEVHSLSLEPSGAAPTGPATFAVVGSQPWVSVLCRFADSAIPTQPVSWFETLFGGGYPGMDHYWRELSHGTIDITGSRVVGWYDLPGPRSDYLDDFDGDGQDNLNFSKALGDCADAADADVFFPDFVGINLMFSERLDCCAWGGGAPLNRDGTNKRYAVTWMPPWGYEAQHVMGHEMGHGFGLPHSSGPYDATYDSNWDVMSGGRACNNESADYGCVGPHTIAFHKDLLGWIPLDRQFEPTSEGAETITISQLRQAALEGDYLMARIPIAGVSPTFYTVEARLFDGYDNELPGEGIVIHRVDRARSNRVAQVVDEDGDGDPNDDGAMWLAGETFVDIDNRLAVKVKAATETGFQVTVITQKVEMLAVSVTGDGTVASTPGGIDCPPDCSEPYIAGLVVRLEARPAEGFVLAGWEGACLGIGDCAVALTGARTVAATFSPPLVITTDSLQGGTMGARYSDRLLATGGTNERSWEIVAGALPPGISLDTSTGVLNGIPEATGTFSLTARTASEALKTDRDYSIQIEAPPLDLGGVVSQLFGVDENLGEVDLRYLDLLGNRNGRFDVGDFRAWLGATAQLDAAVLAAARRAVGQVGNSPQGADR